MDVGDDTFVLPEKGGRPRGGIGLDGAIAGRIGCEVCARFFQHLYNFTICSTGATGTMGEESLKQILSRSDRFRLRVLVQPSAKTRSS